MRFPACSFCGETRVKEDATCYGQTMIEGKKDEHGRVRAHICFECVRHPERLRVTTTVEWKDGGKPLVRESAPAGNA